MKNGPRDRAMRSVLLVIADAANGDGEHAHPGLSNLIDYSLYGRAHVLATLDRLAADGWIVVTGRRSPGKATTYRVCMERDEVQPVDLSDGSRGPIRVGQRSNPRGSEVQSRPDDTSLFPSTVSTTVSLVSKRVQQALDLLAERDMRSAPNVKNPRAFIRACRALRDTECRTDLTAIAETHIDWSPEALADAVEFAEMVADQTGPVPDVDCDRCGNDRWLPGPDSRMVRCPVCR